MTKKIKTKSLAINGIEYAKYEVGKGVLYLKTLKNFGKLTEGESEEFCVNVISALEGERFEHLAYLNI
ncbi:MAG TPA: hypothetical protein VGC65_00335 [Bacteroidia bacterium]|jgi:hypothetical protein